MTSNRRVIAEDDHWTWAVVDDTDPTLWILHWPDDEQARRAAHRIDDTALARRIFPFELADAPEIDGLTVVAQDVRPLSALLYDGVTPVRHHRTLEELGRWLRALHDLSAPAGFGDPESQPRLQTINAFLAARFVTISQDLPDTNGLHEEALHHLADLRNELSAFHPHGRSTWTVGRIDADRIAIHPKTGAIAGILDPGMVSLRPPEYDLAALRAFGVLSSSSLAARAFWRGYGAALTRDLERRIAYFERLIDLERQLGCPADLPTTFA